MQEDYFYGYSRPYLYRVLSDSCSQYDPVSAAYVAFAQIKK